MWRASPSFTAARESASCVPTAIRVVDLRGLDRAVGGDENIDRIALYRLPQL
jgi:hypothetical protein